MQRWILQSGAEDEQTEQQQQQQDDEALSWPDSVPLFTSPGSSSGGQWHAVVVTVAGAVVVIVMVAGQRLAPSSVIWRADGPLCERAGVWRAGEMQ